MRIAVIGHLRHPIAPPFLGGMEAHCHLLVTALVRRGHEVTLFASGDSDPSLPLHPIAPRHYEAELPWAQWNGTPPLRAFLEQAFEQALRAVRSGAFDVVHNNSMHPALHRWAREDGQPMVTSLHVPPFPALRGAIEEETAPWLHQTLTSHAHLAGWGPSRRETAHVVHNGVDADRWAFRAQGNGRAVWSGRITPNKGTAVALDAARRAGIGLDLVGPIDCIDYYRAEVVPRLDAMRIHHGLESGATLVERIGAASVLLATPMWDEPFGLVAAEALACGVPVAALDRGAMREVIGDCGALATDAATLSEAIAVAMGVSRVACRERAIRCFTAEAMIEGYESCYSAAIAGARASSCASTVAVLA